MAEFKGSARRARDLESQLDTLLPQYGRLVGGSTKGDNSLSKQIETKIIELRECIETMARSLEQNPTTANGAVVERYREIVLECDKEFKRISAQVQRDRDRAALLAGSKLEPDPITDSIDPENGDMQSLIKERKHIDNALTGVADVIAQGLEARTSLARQGDTLSQSNLTMSSMVDSLPNISDVISAMQKKKTRHNAIVGTTIGCCVSFLLWAIIH